MCQDPCGQAADVRFGAAGGGGGGGMDARRIEVDGKAELIAELLGEAAFGKAVADHLGELAGLGRRERDVFQAAAKHGAGAVVPVAAGFGADERYGGFEGFGGV